MIAAAIALGVTAAAAACVPGPVRGELRYAITVDATRIENGRLEAASAPGSDAAWTAFLTRFRAGCGAHGLHGVALDRITVEAKPAASLDALLRGDVWMWSRAPNTTRISQRDALGAGRVERGHERLELTPTWAYPSYLPSPHVLGITAAAAPTAVAHLPLQLIVTLQITGRCAQAL